MQEMQITREFEFTDKHFHAFRDLVYQHTGISLSDNKKDLVYNRLSKRLRKLSIPNFDEYHKFLKYDLHGELGGFINAVTTNLTSFFRESHHFQYLSESLLPALAQEKKDCKRLRIWSAGCSTGQEPYSIAMVVNEIIPRVDAWDIKILATDIDTDVLNKAERGIYKEDKITGIEKSRMKHWFHKGKGDNQGLIRAKQDLRRLITFKKLNLISNWPMKTAFDVIFCRNVVIYFDKYTQKLLFDRFANAMSEKGHLFVGHSETLYMVSDRFKLLGNTIYQRCI